MFNKPLLEANLILLNMTKKEFAKKIGLKNVGTLYRKMNGKSDFYRREIEISRHIFGVEKADAIFFGEEVT